MKPVLASVIVCLLYSVIAEQQPNEYDAEDVIIQKILRDQLSGQTLIRETSKVMKNGINVKAGSVWSILYFDDEGNGDTEGLIQQEQRDEREHNRQVKERMASKSGPPVEPFDRKENRKAKMKKIHKVKQGPMPKFNVVKGKSKKESKNNTSRETTGRKIVKKRKTEGKPRGKRMITELTNVLWTDGIVPWTTTGTFSEEQLMDLVVSRRKYEYWTCIRFPEWTSTTQTDYNLDHNNHLVFALNIGCWSYVGNTYWNSQTIACCGRFVCPHELGHALGMPHAHQIEGRDDWIRINEKNISPNDHQWFEIIDGQTLYYPFDMSSTMHYGLMAFTTNYKNTISVLDPDNRNTVGATQGAPDYYDFYTINTAYNCAATHCSGFSAACDANDGYVALVNDACQCVCPAGLNPSDGCTTVYKGTAASKTLSWPDGYYAFPEPIEGCPPDVFENGEFQHCGAGNNQKSSDYHLATTVGSTTVNRKFCVKTSDSGTTAATWSPGSYCILRRGGFCPSGFSEGGIKYDNADPSCNTVSGTLPDVLISGDTTMGFCCRTDGGVEEPIVLPSSTSFVLFQSSATSDCQTVKDMTYIPEYIRFDAPDPSDGELLGEIPYINVMANTDYQVNYCYYVPLNQDCGEVVNLTVSSPEATITSPGYPSPYSNHMECFYHIKAPDGFTIALDFDVFDVEASQYQCQDSVEIRNQLLGQPGYHICGDSYESTTFSSYNNMMLTLRTDSGGSNTGFSATVKLIDESDSCFTVASKGHHYRGNVNYTNDFQPCLPWKEVSHCPFNPYAEGSIFADMPGSSCRNPDIGNRPWCYYDAEDCLQNYCDVCNIEHCYDIFPDCAADILADPTYCSGQEAFRGCQDSCGLCAARVTPPPVSSVTCDPPPGFADAVPVGTLQSSYNPGDTVQFNCEDGLYEGSVISTCLEDATWSGTGPVCGYCGVGWTYYKGECYQAVFQYLKMSEAVAECAARGAIVASGKDQEEMDFVRGLVQNAKMWIGMTDAVTEGVWLWYDGTPVTWTNWEINEPNNFYNSEHCAFVRESGKVLDVYCEYYNYHPFVCSKLNPQPSVCSDRRSDCEVLIEQEPSMCTDFELITVMQCRKSCGLCDLASALPCPLPTTPANADTTQTTSLIAGETITYTCQNGYVLSSGRLQRACLRNGQLTGTAPSCVATDQGTSIVNPVSMRPRSYGPIPHYYFTVNDDMYKIKQNGRVTAWSFYARDSGSVAFQVWKPHPVQENKFSLVGSNTLTAKGGRRETVDVPMAEQILVEPGYLIGIYTNDVGFAMVPFDECGTGESWKYLVSWDPTFTENTMYTFGTVWWYYCRVWSFSAVVGPI